MCDLHPVNDVLATKLSLLSVSPNIRAPKPPTFLSLPREIRQKVLCAAYTVPAIQTYNDRREAWLLAQKLRRVHPTLVADINYALRQLLHLFKSSKRVPDFGISGNYWHPYREARGTDINGYLGLKSRRLR